jgi:hypothetical protein
MSKCYALRKDSRPCRNYARAGEFTCRGHATFFKDPKEWLEATLWNTDETAYRGICRHMKHALEAGAIQINPEDIAEWRKNYGYVPVGDAYSILLNANKTMPLHTNPYLYGSAINSMMYSLKRYHEHFLNFEEDGAFDTYNCRQILGTTFIKRWFCLFRENPFDILERIILNFPFRNRVVGWGYPQDQPFGSDLIWKSLLLNWIEEFGDFIPDEYFFDDHYSLNPLDNNMHRNILRTIPFCRGFAEACEEIWPVMRQREKEHILRSARERTGSYKEELVARTWHPDRFLSWCLDLEEKIDLEDHWTIVE